MTMSSFKARGVGLALTFVSSLVWGADIHHQKIEKVKALTLDGCQIDRKIQQPTKTQHQHMRQCRAYRGGVECVWGHCPIIWGTDWWDKNKMNINHPKAWGNHRTARTRNNQLLKLRGSKEGVYWRDGVTRGEHVGDCGSIVFGGRTKGGRQKTKKKIL